MSTRLNKIKDKEEGEEQGKEQEKGRARIRARLRASLKERAGEIENSEHRRYPKQSMKRPITPRGYDSLRRELQKLKGSRPELARAIEIARAHGDLSENADYDAAKEKSGMVEAKIRDIEAKLAMAEVIDPRKLTVTSRVVFGVSVKVQDVDSSEERLLSLVGADESDIDKGWISCESPLGKALIGKEVGDLTRVTVPGGTREYEIMEVFIDYSEEQS